MKLVIASVISLLSFSSGWRRQRGRSAYTFLISKPGSFTGGCRLRLDKQQGRAGRHIATGKTDADGRIKSLYPQAENMEPGVYKVTFKTGDYFKAKI